MVKTLYINFKVHPDPEIRLTGLSFKKLQGTNVEKRIYRTDYNGSYALDCSFRIDSRTAAPEIDFMIKSLREIYGKIPFGKIKYEGHYSPDENTIFKMVTSN